MRAQSWVWTLVLVLGGLLTGAAALADVSWSGPGWYVESTQSGLDSELVAGPYATEDACNAAKPADTQYVVYACFYEGQQ